MGLYTWLTKEEFSKFSTVTDHEVNIALQEVRSVMPEWYVDEKTFTAKTFFGKQKTIVEYIVYSAVKNGPEVRHQLSARNRETVLNLLWGLYMGYMSRHGKKVFFIDEMRMLHNQLLKKDISFSKFVELLNEKGTGLSAVELYKLTHQCK